MLYGLGALWLLGGIYYLVLLEDCESLRISQTTESEPREVNRDQPTPCLDD